MSDETGTGTEENEGGGMADGLAAAALVLLFAASCIYWVANQG